jgi:hypothetical protein
MDARSTLRPSMAQTGASLGMQTEHAAAEMRAPRVPDFSRSCFMSRAAIGFCG